MQAGLMAVGVVLVFFAALLGFHVLTTRLPERIARRRIQRRVQSLQEQQGLQDISQIDALIKEETRGPVPALDQLVARLVSGRELGLWIEQSGVRVSVSGLLLIGAALGLLLAVITMLLMRQIWVPFVAFGIGVAVPFAVLRNRRRKRLRTFEEQFPEALDLISRAVRAGHAFNTGLKMVADELNEPVGPEFRKTFDEQNFGLSVKDAMNNLSARVPLLDVRFFVTAVLIQRETGGNLSEILDNLAHVVRERFKILRQVRVYTAHGRFTGYVLVALPAVLAVVLMFINPDHMNLLFKERMGQMMLVATIVMQTIGYIWIQRVIKIEV